MKRILLVLFFIAIIAGLSFAQQKYALVIGNGNYANITKLNNPVNDANDMATVLQGLGFTVDKVLNGTLEQMESAAIRLKNRLSANSNSYGFLFYAGHGVQSNGENYLIPVDANIQSESFLRQRAVSVQSVLDELNDAGNALNVVVLDACRDNPFSWRRSGARGLQVVGNQPADSIIVFATSAGSTAADGTDRNGLFTGHLLNNLKKPGLEVNEVFRLTMGDVIRASGSQQRPAVYNQFSGLAYLGQQPSVNTPVQPAPAPAPMVQPAPQPSPAPAPVVIQPNIPVQPVGQTQPGLYTGDAYIPAQPSNSAPQPRISGDRAGLYVNGAYQGNLDLMDSIDWIKLNARSGGNYTIVLGKDEAVPYIQLNFNNLQVSITLKGTGAERRVRYDNNRPAYPMFTVGAGVTFILEDGITLSGLQSNSKSLVRVEGGNFTMNGGSIKDNKHDSTGGGVHIDSGAFTMNNGTISGNSALYEGGGVSVNKGTFTMNNGTISGNSTGNGGGVYCSSRGTFTKSGTAGIIYGSNAPDGQANKAFNDSYGHAVYAYNVGKRDSTARISQALDTRKIGAAGGWE
jgi:hypothetical protein